MKKVLAITLARSGSKRIKKKNIKELNGKPLIYYTIKSALESKKINRFIVSTDCKEIANISKSLGAEVPFIRPKKYAKDSTSDAISLRHALHEMYTKYNYVPDIVINLRPTSPLRNGKIIDAAVNKFIKYKPDLLRTVSKVEGVSHPYWMYILNKRGYARQFVKKININKYYQSQSLPDIYKINGLVDVYSRNTVLKNKILNGRMLTLITKDDESLDIDTLRDFKLAEQLLKQ